MEKLDKDFSYEESIKRIDELLNKMEKEDISLSENMSNFIEAKELIKKCNLYLKNMEDEFELIVVNDEDSCLNNSEEIDKFDEIANDLSSDDDLPF